jgi:hypothetical protein
MTIRESANLGTCEPSILKKRLSIKTRRGENKGNKENGKLGKYRRGKIKGEKKMGKYKRGGKFQKQELISIRSCEFNISLIDLGPSEGLMSVGV